MENMIVINNRQYMGIDEAAKSLGVSVHHVRRWNGLTHPKCRPAGDHGKAGKCILWKTEVDYGFLWKLL